MNLQRYEQNGLELIIDLNTGEVFASEPCLANMCYVSRQSIRAWRTSNQIEIKQVETPTSTGLKTSNLYNEQAIKQALAKYNPNLLLKCVDAGLRVYLHGLAGFKYQLQPEPQLPQNYLEALKALVTSEEQKLQLQAQIEKDKPKVQFAEAIAFSDSSVDFATYAKMLGGVGRNKLMAKLRDIGLLMKGSTLPYQQFCDCGWFEVGQELTEDGRVYPYARITGKGQIAIKKRLDRFRRLEQRTIKAITNGLLVN